MLATGGGCWPFRIRAPCHVRIYRRKGSLVGFQAKANPYLYCLCIEFQTFLLVYQELLHILSLIALKLNDFSHLRIVDNGTIASCLGIRDLALYFSMVVRTKFFLDDFQDFLLIKFLGQTLHGRQGLTTISFCHRVRKRNERGRNMNVR